MKRSFTFISMLGILLFAPLAANAGILTLYDIDFSSPTHTVGTTPSVGANSDQISRINFGGPSVESTFGGVANQSLHFEANRTTYEQIQLNMGQGYSNYQISFDFFSSNLSNSDYAFTLLADTPQVRNFYFHGRGFVQYWAPFILPINGGGFTDNTAYNVMIDYDLLGEEVSIWLDGSLMGTRSFTTSGDDIESFRFSLSPWMGGAGLDPSINVNLDNILVTTKTADVPEPSALLLLSLGLIGLITVRPGSKQI